MLTFGLRGLGAGSVPVNRVIPSTSIVAFTELPKGACSADGMFIWDIAQNGAGFWRRKIVGEACTSTTTVQPDVRTHEDGANEGGVAVTPTTVVKLGDAWIIPLPRAGQSYSWILDDYSKLTPDIVAVLNKQLQTPIQSGFKTPWQPGFWNGLPIYNGGHGIPPGVPGVPGAVQGFTFPTDTKSICQRPDIPAACKTDSSTNACKQYWVSCSGYVSVDTWPAAAPWGTYLTGDGWFQHLGVWGKIIDNGYFGGLGDPSLCGDRSMYKCSTSGSSADRVTPVARFKHPQNGDDWGLWMHLEPVGPEFTGATRDFYAPDGSLTSTFTSHTLRSMALRLTVQKIPTNPWYQAVLHTLFYLPAKLFDLALLAGKELLDFVCGDPATAQSSAKALGPEAQAAVMAAMLLCDKSDKTPDLPPPEIAPVNDATGAPATPWWQWGLVIATGLGIGGFLFSKRAAH